MSVLKSDRNKSGAKALYEFTQGIEVDARLAHAEIRVQRAWAKQLANLGVLTGGLSPGGEFDRASRALDEAQSLIETGKFEWRVEDEDIHMNLERFVTEKEGDLGKRMHLGRSRNDLIATTLRLATADLIDLMLTRIQDLIGSLEERAVKLEHVLVPGTTHLQHGQPVRFSHVLRGHAEAFLRDRSRLLAAKEGALSAMPLGAAALAGTPLAIDLRTIAKELGFSAPLRNSYDAVGDRDFMVETISVAALSGAHLSRLSEDLIYWASAPVSLIGLPKAWSTGSSIMPNKRNPDVPELVRGKSAHLIGAQTDALTLLKGLPTSYNSDLHELKQVLFRSFDEWMACLSCLPSFLREMTVNEASAKKLLGMGHLLATEIADEIAAQGVPFREAYGQVALLVELAESKGVQVHELSIDDFAKLAPKYPASKRAELTFEAAVARRNNLGGTGR